MFKRVHTFEENVKKKGVEKLSVMCVEKSLKNIIII